MNHVIFYIVKRLGVQQASAVRAWRACRGNTTRKNIRNSCTKQPPVSAKRGKFKHDFMAIVGENDCRTRTFFSILV